GAAPDGYEFETPIDVVVLLPESPALPRNLVGARVGTLVDHFLVGSAEVIWCRSKKSQRHRTDAIVGFDCLRYALLFVGDSDTLGRSANFSHGRAVLHDIS